MLTYPTPPFLTDLPKTLNSDSESDKENMQSETNSKEVNPLHEIISRMRLKLLVSKSRVVDRMRKKFVNKKKISFKNALSCSFIESELTAAPALLLLATSTLTTYFVNTLLINTGVKVNPEKVAALYWGKDALDEMLDGEGVNILLSIRSRMNNEKKLILYDRVNKSIYYTVKIVSFWWNCQVITFLVDS